MSLRAALALLLLAGPAAAGEPTARPYGAFSSRLAVDTGFEGAPGQPFEEDVLDARQLGTAGLDARLSDRYQLLLEARGRHRFVERRAAEGEPFLGFNGRRKKAAFELLPGEAWFAVFTARADVKLGLQRFAWGANLLYSPVDNLNPLDLRASPLFASPADLKLPVPAVSARGELGPVEWALAFVPFFEPHRYDVFGQDEALLQPVLGAAVADPAFLVDPSREDALQPLVFETSRPQPWPWNGDLGARVTTSALGPKLGATYLYTREKLPRVRVDPVLGRVLGDLASGLPVEDGTLRDAAARLREGAHPFEGDFPRYHLLGAEGSALLGPVELDLDASFSPSRVFYDQALQPRSLPVATLVAGVCDSATAGMLASLAVVTTIVPGVPAGQRLFLLEREGRERAAHTAVASVVLASVGPRFFDLRLATDLRVLADPLLRSGAAGPRVGWAFTEAVSAALGAELYWGPPLFGFGYWRGNDNVYAELRLTL